MTDTDSLSGPLLKRVTTKYIAREDRVRLTAEASGSHAVTLWLTQRLLSRVAPRLCDWLEKHARDDFQEFAQQRAVASLQKQAAVTSDNKAPGVLVYVIDAKAVKAGLVLTFKGADNIVAARLQLQQKTLRQWLSILYDQYVQAGWPTEIWADWIAEAHTSGKLDRTTLLH